MGFSPGDRPLAAKSNLFFATNPIRQTLPNPIVRGFWIEYR
jgi:hypothetical protein